MSNVDELIEYMKLFPRIDNVQLQSSVPIQDDKMLIVLRVYVAPIKPPDLGIHVGDGLGVIMERGE